MLELHLPENITRAKYPSKKIVCLFALVSQQELYQKNKSALIGVLDMIEGLEYHHHRIKKYEKSGSKRVRELQELSKSAKKGSFTLSKSNHHLATHESVAYINRVGQLMYFFTSDWFKSVINHEEVIAAKIPTILALMPIRNKFVSHRQIDKPRDDDCENLGLQQFGLMQSLSGPIGKPEETRIEYSFPTNQRDKLLKKYHLKAVADVEYLGENNNLVIFTPTLNHQVITNEVINLLEAFFGIEA